jgi:hypothetical protein
LIRTAVEWAGMGIPQRLCAVSILPPDHTSYIRRLSNNTSPSWLSVLDSLQEEGAGQQVLELGVFTVSSGDVGKEDRLFWLAVRDNADRETHLDDASSTPHGSDTSVVKLPVLDLGSLTHEHEALSVRHDLGSVKRLLEVAV